MNPFTLSQMLIPTFEPVDKILIQEYVAYIWMKAFIS